MEYSPSTYLVLKLPEHKRLEKLRQEIHIVFLLLEMLRPISVFRKIKWLYNKGYFVTHSSLNNKFKRI